MTTNARPKVTQLPKPKILQCRHQHVNGYRCESRSDDLGKKWKGPWRCKAHEGKYHECGECRSMLRAFQPPGGW